MISRRTLLKGLLPPGGAGLALAGYGFAVEPIWRLVVTRYEVRPPGWPAGLELRLAVVADLHASEPGMSHDRIAGIVATTNALNADAVVVLGDYEASHRFQLRPVPAREWAPLIAGLKAPLGVHAILGNHDWWDDPAAQARGGGPTVARRELERAGLPVYENDCVRLAKGGSAFWLAGLADQLALLPGQNGRAGFKGLDDLEGTLALVTTDDPVILLAHEPDIFPLVPPRVSLTLAGHTHGGQVRLAGWSPYVPSRFGSRYAYGHIIEEGRHMIVSGGLGCSIMPVRLGVPPEIVVVDISAGPSVRYAPARRFS